MTDEELRAKLGPDCLRASLRCVGGVWVASALYEGNVVVAGGGLTASEAIEEMARDLEDTAERTGKP